MQRPPLVAILVSLVVAAGCTGPEAAEAPDQEPRWEQLAPVPDARTEVSVTTDGERIYLAGGFVPPPDDWEGEGQAPVTREMLVYDPDADTWSDGPDVPVATQHAGFVPVGDLLYLVGGYDGSSFDPRSGTVWIYDPEAEEWSEGAPMPTPRGGLAYAVLDGRIHTIGGTADAPGELDPDAHSPSAEDASVGTHEVYDPATDSWERRAPMPTPRNHHVAGAVDGRIYVTAGREGDDLTMTVTEIYDPETDSWSEGPPLPTGRSGVAEAVLDGRFYVFGGETFGAGGTRTFDDAERLDVAAGTWERLPPMPTARHGIGAAVADGEIYVVSGGPQPGFNFGTANEKLTP